MVHEKFIKDSRGKIRITVNLYNNSWGGNYTYNVKVSVIPPRKRTEIFSMSAATPEEILQAKLEFWELIKPV